MEIQVQGRPLPHLRSRKSLYILALLTLRHNRPVEREWLAGTLWPDVDQGQAFANLRPTLSALRNALGTEGDRLQSPSRRTLLLDMTGDTEVDILAFDEAVDRAELTAWERAVSLYRGPLLEGCTEEWVFQDRKTREQACLKALQRLATASFETGDFGTSAGYWRRAVALDPLSDALRRKLMTALVSAGDRNAALQVYREFITVLQSTDLRAVPDAESSALYRRLREQTRQRASASATQPPTTALPPVSGSLSHALTELIGREDEIQEVAERLRRSRLVTLTGPGGIGKTRLASAVAQEVVREYPDGVSLIRLESLPHSIGTDEASLRPILQQIATTLGVPERVGRPLLFLVTEHLQRKRSLLVLDNCEQVLEPCATVIAYLLRECPGLRILATSREVLHVGGETVWSVPALAAPDPEFLPPTGSALAKAIAGYDAVRLFTERAEMVQKRFAVTVENGRDIALLCSRLGGVPLALELAAARAGLLSPAQILEQLDILPLDALASRLRDAPARHRTLRATLEWSYGLLPPDAQSFLQDLSVFRAGWTLEAAQAVCPDANALEMLTLLRDASFIDAKDSRFTLLETVRQFAAEALLRSDRADAVRRRHARFFSQWLSEISQGWFQDLRQEFQRFNILVEQEYPNLTAALSWCLEAAEDDMVFQLCQHLAQAWDNSGRLEEARYWLDIIAQRINKDENSRGWVGGDPPPLTPRQNQHLSMQVQILAALGDYEKAAEASHQIAASYVRVGDPLGGRTALFNAGQCLLLSDLKRSFALLEECLPLERTQSKDGRANPIILSQLAYVSRLVGQPERSVAWLTEALDLCNERSASDPHAYVWAMRIAAGEAMAAGDLPLALQRFEGSLAFARKLGDRINTLDVLCRMAALARTAGNLDQEETLLTEALASTGPQLRLSATLRLRQEHIEYLRARGNMPEAAALARKTLMLCQGRSRSIRMCTHALLLLLADTELLSDGAPQRPERIARLLGAVHGTVTRLGLVVPERAERDRLQRLKTALISQIGSERFTDEETAGVTLDDEAALQFALSPE